MEHRAEEAFEFLLPRLAFPGEKIARGLGVAVLKKALFEPGYCSKHTYRLVFLYCKGKHYIIRDKIRLICY